VKGYAFASAALLAAWSAGCGKDVSGDTWLVAAGGDTATVAEVGAAWDGLGDEGREVFTSKDNPLGDFLLAFSRKMMIEMEMAGLPRNS